MTDFKSSLYRKTGQAVAEYSMIQDGDRILVALSGGKDSFALLEILRRLQGRAPVKFSLFVCTIHPGFPDFSTLPIESWLKANNYEFEIASSTIYDTVFTDPQKAADGCFYCSRHRRSMLYRVADMKGCQKIALGHHREDFIETVLLSMMYNGKIETMLPIFEAESGKFKIIRPLMYVAEETLERYAHEKELPVNSCYCPLYNSTANLRRVKIKKMLAEFEKGDPEIKNVLFRSLSNFNGRYMLDLRYNGMLKALINREPMNGDIPEKRETEKEA